MSIVNDLATLAIPSLICSITEGEESVGAVDVVFVAGSPANLGQMSRDVREGMGELHVLVGHDYKESLRGVFVGLELVVRAVHSRASSKE